MTDVTEQQLQAMAETIAKKTVEELFIKLGLDVTDVRASQADFAHLRKQRMASEQIGKLAARTLITLSVTGLFSMLLLGIRSYFTH